MTGQGAPGAIENVVIVGGGTAGWMTAAALARGLRHLKVAITVVESEDIGTVGVGEATIPIIHVFNNMLGLDQADFMRACNATFKLGIEFVDWAALGETYIHPFTRYGRDLNNLQFHQMWLRHSALQAARGQADPIDDYNLCCVAARHRRFSHPVSGQDLDLGALHYAFHFDAALYAQYLRRYAETRGVVRREGRIVSVAQDGDNGHVRSVTLASGETVAGDLFVDCSGFRGLLIEGTLKTGYHDWTRYLPANRAIAVPCRNREDPVPYTRSTADGAGWRWRIPLQHRVGNGYVYSSEFISDDDAEARLLSQLDGEPMAAPRRLQFVTGMRKKVWNKNVVAIGLAAGFMEPLESTSIHLVHTAIVKLLAFFPDKAFAPADIAEFNRHTQAEYVRIRDFLILHYKATRRDDTAFWRHCRDMEVPETLGHIMEVFQARGRLMITADHLFTAQSWMAVMLGQGLRPQTYDPLADGLTQAELEAHMASVRDQVAKLTHAMPGHGDYIRRFCRAEAAA